MARGRPIRKPVTASTTTHRALTQWYSRTGNSHTYTLLIGQTLVLLMTASSERPHLVNVPPLLIVEVNGTCDARIERVDRPQHLQRLLRVADGCADQRGFV